MGGPEAPSIGFGSGIERLLLACDAEGVLPVPAARVDAFVVDLVGIADTARLLAELRESGLAADRAYGGRSPKKQFSAADRSGARWAVIIGADEMQARRGRGQGPAIRPAAIRGAPRRDRGVAANTEGRSTIMMRSHRAGDVRADDIGESVAICGWVASRRDHGGKVFLDVRDVAGVLQVVVDPASAGLEVAHRLRGEWVVRVVGVGVGPARRAP